MKGIRLDDVASRLHITKGAVSLKLSGKRDTSLDEIREIAKMLGITLTELCEHDPRVAINENEKQAIDIIRSQPEDKQKELLLILKALTTSSE